MVQPSKLQFYDLAKRKKVTTAVVKVRRVKNPKTGKTVAIAYGTGTNGNTLTRFVSNEKAKKLKVSGHKKRKTATRKCRS